MKEYKENGKVIEITLDSGKVVKVMTEWVQKTMASLDTDIEDTLLMWLEDNDYLVNQEQEELDKQAKGIVKVSAKQEKPKAKTQRERVVKENPDKEFIIAEIADHLAEIGVTDIKVENKAKIITFKYKNKDFKVDLVEKRAPKVAKI